MIFKKIVAAAAACALIGNFLPGFDIGNSQPVMTASAISTGENSDFIYVNMGSNIKISQAKSPYGVLNIPADIEGVPVTAVMMQAFQGMSGITAVNLPETLTSIDFMAFANCSGLTSVTLPKSLKYLEEGAFMNCFGITSFTIYSRDCQITGETAIPNEATIYGYSGSTAETYARTYGRNFVALPEDDISTTTSTSNTTTTTSTTTTTTEPPVTSTTTTTIVDPPRNGRVGDTSGDGEISPLDASTALSEYAALSTGGTYGITDANFYIFDVDNSGEISPMDASLILSYYAYLATGGKIDDMTVWYQQYKI